MFFFLLSVAQVLPLTCRRFTKLRIFNTFDYKYKQNLVSKITNSDKSQAPQFHETAVGRSAFFFIFRLLFFFRVLFFLPPFTIKFPLVIIKLPSFTIKFPHVIIKLPPFTIKLPLVIIKFPPFTIKFPLVIIKLPPFTIKLPPFIIKFPLTKIKYQKFKIKLQKNSANYSLNMLVDFDVIFFTQAVCQRSRATSCSAFFRQNC